MLRSTRSTNRRSTPAPSRAQAKILRESLKRCSQRQDFVARFQERFRAASATVRSAVREEEFEQLLHVLNASFYFVLFLSLVSEENPSRIPGGPERSIARRRGRVVSRINAIWIGSMLETVRESDPQFNRTVESAWRLMIAFALAHLPPGPQMLQEKSGSDSDS